MRSVGGVSATGVGVEERAQTAEGEFEPVAVEAEAGRCAGRKEGNMLLSLNSSIGSKGPIRERAKVEISVVR